MPIIEIIFDEGELSDLRRWLSGMTNRMGRKELLPILLEGLRPIVAKEKSILAQGHNQSGALSMSLMARSGSGDRPGTISVFSAALGSKAKLIKLWSKDRAQLRGQAARVAGGTWGRRVNYAPFVEGGHRIVKRNAAGQLKDTGKRADPVHFAAGAMEALGDAQAEAAAVAILEHIVGK